MDDPGWKENVAAQYATAFAADAGWAVGLRPTLLKLRGMKSDDRKDAYAGVITEIER